MDVVWGSVPENQIKVQGKSLTITILVILLKLQWNDRDKEMSRYYPSKSNYFSCSIQFCLQTSTSKFGREERMGDLLGLGKKKEWSNHRQADHLICLPNVQTVFSLPFIRIFFSSLSHVQQTLFLLEQRNN